MYKYVKGGNNMQKKIVNKIIKMINYSVKVDANSVSTTAAYQPSLPKQYSQFKKNNDLQIINKDHR